MSFEPDGVSRKEYDRIIAQVVDLTKLRLEDELVHGNVMGRIAVALFGDQNNRTDEECVARAAEIGYELSGAKQRAERAEAELAIVRALLRETNELLAEAIVCGPKLRKYMPLRKRIIAALHEGEK